MSGLEVNKILASIFVAVIVVSLISILGDAIINKKNNQQVENAYYIDISEMKTNDIVTNSQNDGVSEQISMFLTSASFEKGEKLFKKCSACHMIASGGKNKIGPNLWSVLGRKTGSISDYKYSKALAAYGKEWTFAEMNGFLIKPSAHIKGTKMAFAGLKNEKDRASVILFMNSKSDSPLPTP